MMGSDPHLLAVLERYFDTVPRASAHPEEIGGFTLFVRDGEGWPFYARPRRDGQTLPAEDDVRRVRARQRALDAPQSFEWVEELTPGLGELLTSCGLDVHRYPLMVLGEPVSASPPAGVRVELLAADHPALGAVLGAVEAGFNDSDHVHPHPPPPSLSTQLASGAARLVGAFDHEDVLGGGSHSPRAGVTELTGIAVLPAARRRGIAGAITSALVADARARGVRTVFLSAGTERVARIYSAIGFVRVGTACIAEPHPQTRDAPGLSTGSSTVNLVP